MQPFSELHEVERRYEELAYKMSTPEAAADADAYAQMMRDYKELTPLMEEYRRYTALQKDEQEAKEALQQDSDPAFTAMVQQELCEIARNLAQSEENLRLLLIPKDADDEKSVILEIRAGAGGEEAALFAHSLWRMYNMYAAKRGWKCETISENPTELGGVKEIVFSTVSSACRRPRPRAASTPLPSRWPSCPKPRKWSLNWTPRICASIPSVLRAQAVSTSTKRPRPSA